MTAVNTQTAEYTNQRGVGIASWVLTFAACIYFGWLAFNLYRTTGVFMNMFASMGVEMPLATRFVIANYRWSYPIFFGSAAALMLGKQFFVRARWPNLTASLAMIVVMDVVTNELVASLYRPLVDFMEKLNR